jgi:hypothetical protein
LRKAPSVQAPITREHPSTKSQSPRLTKEVGGLTFLEVEYWSFSGAWMLVLGIYLVSIRGSPSFQHWVQALPAAEKRLIFLVGKKVFLHPPKTPLF